MNRLSLCAAVAAVLTVVAPETSAKDIRRAGATGVGIGSGTFAHGLSGKHFFTDKLALQANIGRFGNYKHYAGTALSADVIWAMPLLSKGDVEIGWNLGGGAGFASYEDTSVTAFTGLVGLEVLIKQIPLDVVLEVRPVAIAGGSLHILSGITDLTGHIRYYFR